MTPLTGAAARRWCRSHGATFGDVGFPVAAGPVTDFTIPADAGGRVAMVGRHLQAFRGREVLVWFDDWAVWPSGQRMHVFERFLASYGHCSPLIDLPAFLLTSDEHEDAVSFVTIGVLFLWDVHVVGASASPLLFYSHDEYGWAAGR
jgi:hypothetical protein